MDKGGIIIRNFIICLVTVFAFYSCATDPGPKPTFKAGTRVGILNSVEPYMTHRHITIGRFNSFTKQIEVDWKMPAYVNTQLTDALKKDGRFALVLVQSAQTQSQMKQLSDQIGAAATHRRISRNLIGFIENLAKDRDLDIIIMVQGFEGESPWKIADDPILLQGYGLFTRRTLLATAGITNSRAHPYAQIRVVVFNTQPVSRIGAGLPRLRRARMDDFNWPTDIENVPQSEIDKLRPIIQDYADQAVTNALQSAQRCEHSWLWRDLRKRLPSEGPAPMQKSKAIEILKLLADGMHPITGEPLDKNHVINEPDVIRALNTAVAALLSDEKKIKRQLELPERVGKPWNEKIRPPNNHYGSYQKAKSRL